MAITQISSRTQPPFADVLILLGVCALVFFLGLGDAPLWDDDETRFAVVARGMLRSGDWIVPRYQGELADKPAALFWTIAGSFSLLGQSATAARIASAISATLAVVAAWRLSAVLCGRAVALWTGVGLSTSLLIVTEGRAATADATLLAVITLMALTAVEGWWRGGLCSVVRWSTGRAVLFGALAGVGILLKGLVALLVPLFAFWVFACWASASSRPEAGGRFTRFLSRGWRALLILRPMSVLLATLVVAGPWHYLVGRETGGEWLSLFYLKHHLSRIASPMEGHAGFPLFQVVGLMCGLFPWSVFLPLAFWRTARSAFGSRDDSPNTAAQKFLFSWVVVWLVVFTFSATQLPNYVLPVYPAACAMVAALLVEGCTRAQSLRSARLFEAAGGLVFGGGVIAVIVIVATRLMAAPEIRHLAWLGSIPLVTAIAFALAVRRGRRSLAICFFGAGAVALIVAVFVWGAPLVGALNPIPRLVARADASSAGRAPLATYRFSVPGVLWNADRPMQVCQSAAELATFLSSEPEGCALVDATAFGEVRSLGIEIVQSERALLRKHDVLLVRASSRERGSTK